MFVGVDFETTGLNLDTLYPLEVALVLYDDSLREVDHVVLLIQPPQEALDNMHAEARSMHEANGLLEDVKRFGYPLDVVRKKIFQRVDYWVMEGYDIQKAPLLGNSVHFDRNVMREFFYPLNKRFHHRNVDVSTLTELAKRWRPKVLPDKRMPHRALEDVRESARTLRDLRGSWFKGQRFRMLQESLREIWDILVG